MAAPAFSDKNRTAFIRYFAEFIGWLTSVNGNRKEIALINKLILSEQSAFAAKCEARQNIYKQFSKRGKEAI